MGQLRDYERAILTELLDGEEHDRESLIAAGVRACSPEHALGQYQRDNKDESLTGSSVSERLTALARQEVKGAKTLVGKAMSHLVDRKLMEVTQTAMPGKKLVRTHFRITERGRKRLKVNDADPKAVEEWDKEILSERSRQQWKGLTPEERSEKAKQGHRKLTPEQRSDRARRAIATRRAKGEDIGESIRQGIARNLTPKQLSERARKGVAARRSPQYFEQMTTAALGSFLGSPDSLRSTLKTKDKEPRTPAELFNDVSAALGKAEAVPEFPELWMVLTRRGFPVWNDNPDFSVAVWIDKAAAEEHAHEVGGSVVEVTIKEKRNAGE